MAISTRTVSIAGSVLLSLVLIVVAYALSSPAGIHIVGASSNEEIFKSYTEKDTDGDGLKDWQEVVYGTDLENPESVQSGMLDSEALEKGLITPRFQSSVPKTSLSTDVPGINPEPKTLTEEFAQDLLKQYLSSKDNTPVSRASLENFVTSSIEKIERSTVLVSYKTHQVIIEGHGKTALEAYIKNMNHVFSTHLLSTEKDITEYFSDSVLYGDSAAAIVLKEQGIAFTNAGAALIALSVPEEIASDHLRLANSLARMGTILSSLALFQSDPIRGLVAIELYVEERKEFALSLQDMANTLKNNL